MFALPLLALVVLPSPFAAAPQHDTATLAEMRERQRPLLIFAPTMDDPRVNEQLQLLAPHNAELAERNVVVIVVPADPVRTQGLHLTRTDAASARTRFDVPESDFAVVLIGKDGGEKLRSTTPLSIDKLDATIDAMPMRREEMQK